mgnify:CR=1 FL=1|tara:strand:+ start:792 stop:1004 length:213 start_codon:yes stop_codon:yes gene_type:complete
MKTNSIKTLNKTIQLLDKRILVLLLEKELDVIKIDSLSSVRTLYIEELNNKIRVKNTRKMFNKDYYERRN